MTRNILTFITFLALTLSACGNDKDDSGMGVEGSTAPPTSAPGPAVTAVTRERIDGANAEAGNWLSHGRTYDEQRFSPLDEINRDNVGELATAGDLVFQGSLIGEFAAYGAGSGERVWQFPAQTGIAAAPISDSVNDQQHIAVVAGWGTIMALLGGEGTASLGMKNHSRILTFNPGGSESLPFLAACCRTTACPVSARYSPRPTTTRCMPS
ncbi:MAG: hypothetical protein OER22_05600 [Gammaproteobacteria bacterium]|nr:hypothetical protein [Gammaproteobacteria bacterium]MDH3372543.1 hypothetical protein [Gammaproteobacteria bacterium]MDH3408288.1 hypothetical protein [Gammaproteobacteria bacterium]MDH3552073.1 hypothetical protein [Gammaproteobacteria bacterium]